MKFTKPATSFEQQIQILEARGMNIPDHDRAHHYLAHLNYYRIGAYWLPFEEDHETHTFKKGTSFETVLSSYVFDRELRLLIIDAIERVEVSIRTQWAYYLAHSYGTHAHLQTDIFKSKYEYDKTIANLMVELNRSREVFIKHLISKYDEPMPPIWAIVEIISFGQLSKFYSNIKTRKDRNAIAEIYNLDEVVMSSFLHHLNTVRNSCAHHSRIWNRNFTVTMKIPRKGAEGFLINFNSEQERKIYNTLVLLEYLMEKACPGTHWRKRLITLLDEHDVDTGVMGFPDDWKSLPIWNDG